MITTLVYMTSNNICWLQGETPLDLAKQRKNVWMINHLQEARQAKGYDSPSYLKRLKIDKVEQPIGYHKEKSKCIACTLTFLCPSAGVQAEGDVGNSVPGDLAGGIYRRSGHWLLAHQGCDVCSGVAHRAVSVQVRRRITHLWCCSVF